MADEDMIEGYLDGFTDDRDELPTSFANRSESYRHGWLNGRDDRRGRPRATAGSLRELSRTAQRKDGWSVV